MRKLLVSSNLKSEISHLHPAIKKQLRAALEDILINPHLGKPLKRELEGLFSYRLGRYRIIYQIQRQTIKLVTFGPRQSIYLKTYQLLK